MEMLCLILLVFLGFADASTAAIETGRDHVYTNTWVLQMSVDERNVDRIALKYGFTNKKKMFSNYYIFEDKNIPSTSLQPSRVHEKSLLKEPMVEWFAQQVRQKRVLYQEQHLSFDDKSWKDQEWYLNSPDGKGMNVYQVWQQGITGKGIVVAIVDDGLQKSHPDLKDNYDRLASIDLVDLDNNTDPVGINSGHGNRCGGVIAAVANNNKCGVGIAFNAKIGGIRLIGEVDPTDAMEALAFGFNPQHIDIYSCSWGPGDMGWTMDGPKTLASDQLAQGTTEGRGGRGSIYVFAAGNGGRNYDSCAYNGYVNSVHTIAISGVARDGGVPPYAERCTAIMASTYSRNVMGGVQNVVTADRDGACTSSFSGTSAAAAMASGIISLALEANQNLTWRDVQHLIVYSSRPDIPRSSDWTDNGAGISVSSYFGFGLMDASALVTYSKSWSSVPQQVKCVIPGRIVKRPIRQSHVTEVKIDISNDACVNSTISYLEHVVVIIRARFDRRGYLEGNVTSPSGTVSHILPYRPYDLFDTRLDDWPILSLHFWGERARGTWRLRLRNHYPKYKFEGTLLNWTLVLYGTASDPLASNPHVPKPQRKTTTTPESTTVDPSDVTPHTDSEGLSDVEIALICCSLGLFVILAGAVCVLVKFEVIRCGHNTFVTKPPDNIILPEQCTPLRGPEKSETHV